MCLLQILLMMPLLNSCGSGSKVYVNNNCQAVFDSLTNKEVYNYVDRMPEYPGGNVALLRFITENFKYPRQNTFQASFQLEFVIDSDGQLIGSGIKNKNEMELSVAEKEILKIISRTPKWQAGKCNRKRVPVKMILPLKF